MLINKAFKARKRSMVFIVAHRVCTTHIFEYIADLFDSEKSKELKHKFSSQDILATRNSIMLYKAFKKDRTREVYICRNSFNVIQSKYPFMCLFNGASIYMQPKKTHGYPSEIIDRRLYLGDKTHAENETIIHNLGITHVLNVTHNIPNYFEESKKLNVKYQRVSIEDNKEVPIELSFKVAYEFIETALSKKKKANKRFVSTSFDLVQNFSDSRKKSMISVVSTAMSNDLLLDLGVMTATNIDDPLKDKNYEIATMTQYNMQSSNNQNRVLVHCAMGMSRSATMVIMYLMRKYQMEMQLAFDMVKHYREKIDPNEGFMAKLVAYNGKQYKLKRTLTYRDAQPIARIDEADEFSQASESSSTSEEDLMTPSRKYSLEV